MIFVSYAHADERWRKRFERISKPLSRSEKIEFWSDCKIGAGKWEKQIEKAMESAEAVVLLVSDSFLASDYIVGKELPYFMKAAAERGLMVFWAYLHPCDLKRFPKIREFQAMTLGGLEPLSKLTDWQWRQTMVNGCDMIDEHLKKLEQPAINAALNGKSFPRIADGVLLLTKPARRDVEVLVFAGGVWHRQNRIKSGSKFGKIYLGSDPGTKGTRFQVIALTTEEPLTARTYANLPDYRTKSNEITLIRC